MGFRSTWISHDYGVQWTDDWLEHRDERIGVGPRGLLYSRQEMKLYDDEVFEQIGKGLREAGWTGEYEIVVMHECGGVGKVVIDGESIRRGSMQLGEWIPEDWHWHCGSSCDQVPKPADGRCGRSRGPERERPMTMDRHEQAARELVYKLIDELTPPEYNYGPHKAHDKHEVGWVVFKNAEVIAPTYNAHLPFAEALRAERAAALRELREHYECLPNQEPKSVADIIIDTIREFEEQADGQ